MIRFVFLLLVVVLAAWGATQLVRALRRANVDWTGVTFIAGFVALAFWLRHVTGMG